MRSGFRRKICIRNRIAKRFCIFQLALGNIDIRSEATHSENHTTEAAVARVNSETGNTVGLKHIDFQFIVHILRAAVAEENRFFGIPGCIFRPTLQQIMGHAAAPGQFGFRTGSSGFCVGFRRRAGDYAVQGSAHGAGPSGSGL